MKMTSECDEEYTCMVIKSTTLQYAEWQDMAYYMANVDCLAVQGGSRVSQMTKTYNDIDAVTRLLEEKEKDLELAARIGQKLLQKNQSLELKNETLEEELTNFKDKVTQLRHELLRKSELLRIYQNHENDGSESDSTDGAPLDFLQKKIKVLEDENFHLTQKTAEISLETEDLENREHHLFKELTGQVSQFSLENDQLSEELSKRIEECNKQQEDITYLLAQVADFQAKHKQLKVENEELHVHLQASKECQNDLTAELADLKEKYEEILELLHDAQDQLRKTQKKGLPSVSRRGMYSSYVNPDSLASELESTFSSDSGSFNPNTRQLHNLKVFETVRYAKQNSANASSSNSPARLPHLYGSPAVHSSNLASGSICSVPSLSSFTQLPLPQSKMGPAAMSSPHIFSNRPASTSFYDRGGNASDSEGSVCADNISEDSSYSSLTSLGRPGAPGSNDLETALKRLSLRRQSEAEYLNSVRHPFDDSGRTPNQCRTPDSIMSTGSMMSGFSGLTGVSGYAYRHYHIPEKLQIVKPIEGSVTLHQWQQLATPHLGGIFEDRPGVQIKGERKLEEIDDVYTLTDLEEDEEINHPGKIFDSTSTIYTYTTSTVLHPDDVTRVTSSVLGSQVATSGTASSSCHPSCLNSPQGRERATSTFSTTLSLAKVLRERGITATDPFSSSDGEVDVERTKEEKADDAPATPCNSPEGSPPSTPLPFAPLKIPSLAGLGTALGRGAELLGGKSRNSSGSRTQVTVTTTTTETSSVAEAFAKIKLVENVNRLGLSAIVGPPAELPKYTLPTYHHLKPSSPMAQLTSLRGLNLAKGSGSVTMTASSTTLIAVKSLHSTERSQAPPTTLEPSPPKFESNFLELGTISALASFRKGGLS